MKVILCYFFGLIAGVGSVCGQTPATADTTHRFSGLHLRIASVRIMQPDHMACVTADASRVQRMPVRRMSSTDPMPNGVRESGKTPMSGVTPMAGVAPMPGMGRP